jgi:hypothetical protein
MIFEAINIVGIVIRNVISTNNPWLFYSGVFAISFIIMLIYLAIIDLAEWVLESKTWFWISLLGKGITPEYPVKFDKIRNRGCYPIEANNGPYRTSLVKIVLKMELGRATSYVNVYATP